LPLYGGGRFSSELKEESRTKGRKKSLLGKNLPPYEGKLTRSRHLRVAVESTEEKGRKSRTFDHSGMLDEEPEGRRKGRGSGAPKSPMVGTQGRGRVYQSPRSGQPGRSASRDVQRRGKNSTSMKEGEGKRKKKLFESKGKKKSTILEISVYQALGGGRHEDKGYRLKVRGIENLS